MLFMKLNENAPTFTLGHFIINLAKKSIPD